MTGTMFRSLFVIFGLAAVLRADTVTSVDNVSIFGKVVRLTSGQLQIYIEYPGGNGNKVMDRSNVRRIEFNKKIFNDGAPPKALGLHEPPKDSAQTSPEKEPAAATGSSDTLFLRDGSEKSCEVVAIDDKVVSCQGGQTVPKLGVLSIRFAKSS